MLGHLGNDAAAVLLVDRAVRAVLTPVAIGNRPSVLAHAEGFGVFRHQPGGWRGGGSAQDNADAMCRQDRDGTIEPGEVAVPFCRLQPGPGKLRPPDHVEAGLGHQARIDRPALFWPMLWVVVNAVEEHRFFSFRSIRTR